MRRGEGAEGISARLSLLLASWSGLQGFGEWDRIGMDCGSGWRGLFFEIAMCLCVLFC